MLLGLSWTSIFPLYRLRYKKFISLPGKLDSCEVKLNSLRNETLTVVWINDNYIKYQHIMDLKAHRYSMKKNVTKSIKFLKFVNVYGDGTVDREYHLILEEKKKRSWKQAKKLCKEFVDGHLPWFEGKDRLLELLSLFKFSKEIPTIEAIYIGLRFYAVEVSTLFVEAFFYVQLGSISVDFPMWFPHYNNLKCFCETWQGSGWFSPL